MRDFSRRQDYQSVEPVTGGAIVDVACRPLTSREENVSNLAQMPGTLDRRAQERERIGRRAMDLHARYGLTKKAIAERLGVDIRRVKACMQEVRRVNA